MHQTLSTVSQYFTNNNLPADTFEALGTGSYFLHNVFTNDIYGVGSCKDSLMCRLVYFSGFGGGVHHDGNSDIYFGFAENFKTFKPAISDTFKLFTDQIPCTFYKAGENQVIIRLKPSHFFFSKLPLVDLFTVVCRMVYQNQKAFTSKKELLAFIGANNWGSYNYTSTLMTAILQNFQEFLEILENPEAYDYLKYSWGLRWASNNIAADSRLNVRDTAGNDTQIVITPPQILKNFAAKG